MEFQQLKHLIASAELGNLAKAAGACNITQSGLSRSVTSLEARLGVPLLVRSPKGVEATPFGLVVIERAKVIVNEVARTMEEVRAMEGGRVGAINFGITQNFAHYAIPALIGKILDERPDLQFNVVTGGFLELIEKVRQGLTDFVFGLLSNVHPTDELTVEVLRDHYSRVIGRSTHPLASKRNVSIEDLAAARWATLNGEGFQRNFLGFFDAQMSSQPRQVLKTDSIDLITRTICDADVLTVLPAAAVKAEIDGGTLSIIDCETPAEATSICLVYRSAGVITPQMKLVIDRIRDLFCTKA